MSRLSLMIILVLGSFLVAALTATAAIAAPKAPKGASVEFITALAGVQCSELYDGEWSIKGDAGEALERLDAKEAAMFDSIVGKWAAKACTTNNTVKGE